jgi:hypothetical protein
MTEQIWFKDPSILFTGATWNKFVPMQGMTTSEALNSVVRFTIYFSVLLYLTTTVTAYIMTIPIVMVATMLLYNMFPNGKTIESFKTKIAGKQKYTMPSAENPFMNVLLTEIQDNPNRPDAAPVSRADVKADIYKAFQKTADMYIDTSDVFDQSQAMRTFHTLQSSTVPDNLDDFKKWLAKGIDEPDFSSAPPARHAKVLSETHVVAKGSMQDIKSSTEKPKGQTPSTKPDRRIHLANTDSS